jgi:hypothetical protein
MKSLTFLVLMLTVISVAGQEDPIEKQILNFDDSRSVMISRGRNFLLDRFIQDDIDKVKEIKDFLIEKAEDENYTALYPVEHFLILYWTREYDELGSVISKLDSLKLERYNQRIRPPVDMLFQKLQERTLEYAEVLEKRIQNARIDPETKEFLLLNFRYLMADTDIDPYLQDTLNTKASMFLEEWPQSSYNTYIKRFVRHRYVPKKWGMAFEFFSGYGIYTGALSESYTNNVPVGVAFDICYRNFELYLRDYIGFNSTKKDFSYSSGVWNKGSNAMVFLPEASLGYVISNNNRFKVSPFAGIGAMDIAPPSADTEKYPDLKEVSLEFTTTWMTGVNIDIKFGPSKVPDWKPKTSYGFMRIRYAYNAPQYARKYAGASGNMHYVTIGFGGFARGVEREM